MYVNPFVVGVVSTLLVEVIALAIYAVSYAKKNKK